MISNHLSETEIQQYAFDQLNGEKRIAEHVDSCESCRSKIAEYQLLFLKIKEQPDPVFDFNLSGLVLSQLPKAKPAFSWAGFFINIIVFKAIFFVGLLAYLFSKYLLTMFKGITFFTIYLMLAIVVTIVLFQCFEIYKKYQKQMNTLNF